MIPDDESMMAFPVSIPFQPLHHSNFWLPTSSGLIYSIPCSSLLAFDNGVNVSYHHYYRIYCTDGTTLFSQS